MTLKLQDYVGNKSFYKKVLAISVPMMVQFGITNFVSLLDNIMVGRLGTESMSGVSIVNQFVFMFNVVLSGAVSAAGIFTAQYHGLNDKKGIQHTFRIKLLINTACTIIALIALIFFDDELISMFIYRGSSEGDLALTLIEGKAYLKIMLSGLFPYAVSQVYVSTMRETENPIVPMYASIVAVSVNFALNYILIFGNFGFPALGVTGAAIATVISRFAELAVITIWGHLNKTKCKYLIGIYKFSKIPRILFMKIVAKGFPLIANEFFWSLAVTMRNQCYSTRGLEVVAAQSINSTILNLFNVIYIAIGSSIGIIVGNQLGAGKLDEAKESSRKMMFFCVMCSVGLGLLLSATSTLFPMIYNTTENVRHLTTYMMITSGAIMPFCAYAFGAYFTMRSGGKVMITLLFDSVYMWVVVIPVAALLSYCTNANIFWLFAICQGTEIIKALFGYVLLKRGTWVRQLVSKE